MKSTYTLLAAALLGAARVSAGSMENMGCYSATTGMTLKDNYNWNSMGHCGGVCLPLGYATFAMYQFDCYCGQQLPPASLEVDNSTCSMTCPGYPTDLCGGQGVFSVYLTGLDMGITNANTNNAKPSESSTVPSTTPAPTPAPTSAPTAIAKPSTVTMSGQTIVVTASAVPNSATSTPTLSASSSSGPSKAGIAAGVVVGVVALVAIVGGLFLFFRRKARREIEAEHGRQAAINTFTNGGRPPMSSGGLSFNDMRLDPAVMAQRRMSDGSIADNQDYSRRILKVTNV